MHAKKQTKITHTNFSSPEITNIHMLLLFFWVVIRSTIIQIHVKNFEQMVFLQINFIAVLASGVHTSTKNHPVEEFLIIQQFFNKKFVN